MIKSKTGIVSWFNNGSGEGVVRTSDGRRYHLHYSVLDPELGPIVPLSDPRHQWRTIEVDTKVQVTVMDDEFTRHVTTLVRL